MHYIRTYCFQGKRILTGVYSYVLTSTQARNLQNVIDTFLAIVISLKMKNRKCLPKLCSYSEVNYYYYYYLLMIIIIIIIIITGVVFQPYVMIQDNLGNFAGRHIPFYYIDRSVLLENTPLVKFIRNHFGYQI